MKSSLALRNFLLGSSLLAAAATSLQAANYYWDGTDTTANADGGNGTWTEAGTNFDTLASGGTNVAAGSANVLVFAGTAGTVTGSPNTASAPRSVGVTFNTTGYTLNGALKWSSNGVVTGANSTATTINATLYANGKDTTFNVGTSASITMAGNFDTSTTKLIKSGAGLLTLTNTSSTNSAPVTITGGTLQIGSAGRLNSGSTGVSITFSNSSILQYSSSAAQTLSGAIVGAGSILKDGAGTLTLSNAGNTYSGATTVSNGALVANGTLSGTSATVKTGATLRGTGGIGGSVTIEGGGNLAPGLNTNTIESLTTGALSLQASSTYAYQMNKDAVAGAEGDLTAVTGNLTLAMDNTSILTLAELGTIGTWADDFKLTLISYTNLWNGGLFTYGGNVVTDGSQIAFSGKNWVFDYNDTVEGANFTGDSSGKFVTMTAIPEPRAALLGGLGMLILLRRRRG